MSKHPEPGILRPLILAGRAAPSADNAQPWHFWWDGSKLYLSYDAERVSDRSFAAEDPATLLAMGGVVENIIEAAAAARLDLDIEYFPEAPSSLPAPCYAAIRPPEVDAVHYAPISTLPCLQRHTNRFSYRRTPLPPSVKEELGGLSEGGARIQLLESEVPLKKLAQLVRRASEIRFQTREVHEWLSKSLRFTTEDVKKADGLDIDTLALPPGGKFVLKFIGSWDRMRLLNRMGSYRLLAMIDSAPIKKGPAVLVLTGNRGMMGAIQAGRLLSRAWSRLNRLGLAAHPYYVVSDQLFRLHERAVPDCLTAKAHLVEQGIRTLLDMGSNEELYMLLRVGYPTRKPPLSLRLPLEKIFTDLTAGGTYFGPT